MVLSLEEKIDYLTKIVNNQTKAIKKLELKQIELMNKLTMYENIKTCNNSKVHKKPKRKRKRAIHHKFKDLIQHRISKTNTYNKTIKSKIGGFIYKKWTSVKDELGSDSYYTLISNAHYHFINNVESKIDNGINAIIHKISQEAVIFANKLLENEQTKQQNMKELKASFKHLTVEKTNTEFAESSTISMGYLINFVKFTHCPIS